MKELWKVDMNRLIELVASRMYSDHIKAGIRELITNSLDARLGKVEIWIDYDDIHNRLRYTDSGMGIDPKAFKEIYGKIASAHKRKKGTRGFFGIGRMSLISASDQGYLISYRNGKVYTWKFNKEGWEGPTVANDLDDIGHGVFIMFEGLHLENLGEIEEWIRKTFSIPLLRKECTIKFQHIDLYTKIQDDYEEHKAIGINGRLLKLYTKEEMDGTLFICQKGILVKEEDYTGLTAYVDQNFLDIKTDREGFVNNEKYRLFKKVLKKKLAKLRPQKSFEKMEVDFIKRLMREFKRHWFTKVEKKNHVMEKLKIEFPKEGEEVLPKVSVPANIPEEPEPKPVGNSLPPSDVEVPQLEDKDRGIVLTPFGREVSPPTKEPAPIEIADIKSYPAEPSEDLKDQGQTKTATKVVKIKGAKPVEMGEDFPMVFFESDPFVLVFNTSHPVFKKLIEKGKLGSHQLAVLFERMFECAYSDKYPSESREDLKKRWKEVDQKLKKIFK